MDNFWAGFEKRAFISPMMGGIPAAVKGVGSWLGKATGFSQMMGGIKGLQTLGKRNLIQRAPGAGTFGWSAVPGKEKALQVAQQRALGGAARLGGTALATGGTLWGVNQLSKAGQPPQY